jgi:thiamine pyrophosphokinase
MILPSTLINKTEWTFMGPMGPLMPDHLKAYSTIAVDGGANFIDSSDIWVGDADSVKTEIKATHVFRLSVEKDQSDLAMALSLFQEQFHYKFHFWGFLGGRKDHELFNLGEALRFLEAHQECQILFYREDGKLAFHLLGSGKWKFTHIGLFSLGTLKKTSVKLKGECHYPIPKSKIITPLSSFGLSNVGQGDLELQNDGPVFVYYPEGK